MGGGREKSGESPREAEQLACQGRDPEERQETAPETQDLDALLADLLAPAADFFSIGTNDLAQYALAVDRANPDVAPLYRPLHPAILRMVRSVVEAGRAFGKPVAVCGELAADPIGIAVLVGLGILDVSVTPVAIAGVKESLSAIDSARVRALAAKALAVAEASEVEKLFRGHP